MESREFQTESTESPSDRVRRMIAAQGIEYGIKEGPKRYSTLVTVFYPGRKTGLRGRIFEINYDDPDPYLVLGVHHYKREERIPLGDVLDIKRLEQEIEGAK